MKINLGTTKAHKTAAVYLAIAVISTLHYLSNPHAHTLHDVYRRLYYLPIIFAAFQGGLRGGLLAAAVVCAAYAPHAFGHIGHDPNSNTQKSLEMVLFFAVALTTGSLVSRLQRTQLQLEATTKDLRGSIARLHSTEEQLVQAAKLAAVGRLSAGLAHEIRNPLASIKGSAEILSDDFPAGHPKRRLLEVLIEESVRLNHVLSRFLAFARPRPLERQSIEIGPEIDQVVALLQSQKEGGAVPISVVSSLGSGVRFRGDREQLRQVLLNVLLNACQAAGEAGRVDIRCQSKDGLLQVLVHDSGPGFTAEAIENAFTPFFTTKDGGTGLGLAVSHQIIESHGGRIRVRNDEDGGGVVELEIPLEGPHVEDPAH
jgi:two-component system, NtrC family, sensor histidine kinase HydH